MKTTSPRLYDVARDQADAAPGGRSYGRPHPAGRIDARLTSCNPRSSVFIFGECDLHHARLRLRAVGMPRRVGQGTHDDHGDGSRSRAISAMPARVLCPSESKTSSAATSMMTPRERCRQEHYARAASSTPPEGVSFSRSNHRHGRGETMSVIPRPQRHRNGEPARLRPLNREAPIYGSFRSPSGGPGTMTRWMRLNRFHVVSDKHQAEAAPAPAPATAPPPGLVPAIAPVASAVGLKRRHLGFVLEEDGQPR